MVAKPMEVCLPTRTLCCANVHLPWLAGCANELVASMQTGVQVTGTTTRFRLLGYYTVAGCCRDWFNTYKADLWTTQYVTRCSTCPCFDAYFWLTSRQPCATRLVLVALKADIDSDTLPCVQHASLYYYCDPPWLRVHSSALVQQELTDATDKTGSKNRTTTATGTAEFSYCDRKILNWSLTLIKARRRTNAFFFFF